MWQHSSLGSAGCWLLVPYRIEYAPETTEHLEALTARQRATALDAVSRRLKDQPTVETRNRKRLRPNPLSSWQLRIGNLRVYYDVNETPQLVTVRAVGIKDRQRVRVGKQVSDEGFQDVQDPRDRQS